MTQRRSPPRGYGLIPDCEPCEGLRLLVEGVAADPGVHRDGRRRAGVDGAGGAELGDRQDVGADRVGGLGEARAFLAKEVHIVGNRKWNRRGAMVTDRYQHVRHHPQLADLAAYAEQHGLAVIGIDNLPGSVPLETYELPTDCILLFGQEGPGLTEAAHASCTDVLSIAQFGSTRSINASAAAAIAMHAWIRRHTFNQKP